MFYHKPLLKILLLFIVLLIPVLSSCSVLKPSDKYRSATLLKTENATQQELINQVNHFAKVNSMYAKMDLKFEDNSYAEAGIAEKFKTADGLVVVQRPANIQLNVQVPFIKSDVVQMTSNGEKFRVAILQDDGSGKYKNFISGTNDADYSILQKEALAQLENNGNGKDLKQSVNAFANLRPQHFTDAILMRPVDTTNYLYLQSTTTQEEIGLDNKNKNIVRWHLRGYYLLDEFSRNPDDSYSITRRFWFDRVGKVRLARQQLFDAQGEIESDIVYGQEGNLTETGDYQNLPLEITVTRPKEKYKLRLRYQTPQSVSIGKTYPIEAFMLENRWNLPEIDLDKKIKEMAGQKSGTAKSSTELRGQ
jgi:hypothetical protein